jgi:hypothetical protein
MVAADYAHQSNRKLTLGKHAVLLHNVVSQESKIFGALTVLMGTERRSLLSFFSCTGEDEMAKKTRKAKAAKDVVPLSFRVDRALWAAMKQEAAKNSRSIAKDTMHRLKLSFQASQERTGEQQAA